MWRLLERIALLCNMEMLRTYGTDMTTLAEMVEHGKGRRSADPGGGDPLIGRDKEMEDLMQALLKRRNSNVCLVGDAGVGKTALVEALAIKIVQRSVPPKLIGKRIFSIDMARLVAGATDHRDFEKRLKDLLEEVQQSEGLIILFIDGLHTLIKDREDNGIANILKPALATHNFKCIGATTLVEYRRYIERDATLKHRFETIQVREPSREDSIEIIRGIIHTYQSHHDVTYTENAIISAVDLSKRYIRERFLPGKAIDLIDKAGARVQMLGETGLVTRAEIERTVSACTGVPVSQFCTKESLRLVAMEITLKRNIVGQDEAVTTVCRSIRRARAGIRDKTIPIGCFLFVDPNRVGKTEMAKVVADVYFGSEEAMVSLDTSDCHTVIEAVRRRPHSLVLFDKIDKGHEKMLLQILDDGRLSDCEGNMVDFSDTIVILTTSNATIGNSSSNHELFNRFHVNNNIVVFKPLEKEHIEPILEIMIEKFCTRVAAKKKIRVEFSQILKESLVVAGYDERYGARLLKSVFTDYVETKLAEEILFGRVLECDTVTMDITSAKEIVCQKETIEESQLM